MALAALNHNLTKQGVDQGDLVQLLDNLVTTLNSAFGMSLTLSRGDSAPTAWAAATQLTAMGITASVTELNYTDVTTLGTVQASKAVTASAANFITWTATSASTDGGTSVEPFSLAMTMTGVGGVGGRAKFAMTTNVALGGWSNALKGQVTYGSSGKTTGLGSAICAEMTLSAGTAAGTYAPIEIELNMGSAGSCGTATSLIYASVNDAAATTFDTSGYLLNLAGVTAAGSKMFASGGTITNVNEITHGLRVRIAGADYYLLMATSAAFTA